MNILKKNIILCISLIGFLIVSYYFAITPTLVLKKQVKELEVKETKHNNTLKKINDLKSQDLYYKKILQNFQISSETSIQNNFLIEIINTFKNENKLTVVSFDEPHSFEEENTVFKTYTFKVRGSYKSITKLVYQLEQKYKFGKINSLVFEKKKNYKTYKKYLECQIYIQRIE